MPAEATVDPALLMPCRPSGPPVAELSHEELAGLINSIMAITNVAFFGLAGASLKLVSRQLPGRQYCTVQKLLEQA